MLRKQKRKRNNKNVISISKLVSAIENHKELLLLICSAVSLVVTAIWNIAFDAGRLGYATYWNIDYRYAPNDKQNFFVMFIITLCFSALILYPIFQYAKWTALHKKAFILTLTISVAILITPLILFLLKKLCPALSISVKFVHVLVGLFLFIIPFSVFYYPLYFDIKETNEQNRSKQRSSTAKTIKKSAILSMLVVLLISISILLVGVFFLGMSIAHRNEYSFLVDNNYDFQFKNDGIYDVILSETDDYYYQAKCRVTINEDQSRSLNVFCNQITVCEKPEQCFVIKVTFSEIKKQENLLLAI